MTAFDDAADELNEVIVSAEDALRAHQFRVSADVDLGDGITLRFGRRERGRGNREARWSLYVSTSQEHEADLLATSIDIRMRAIRALPLLVRTLKERKEIQLSELLGVVTFGRMLVAELMDQVKR